MRPVVGKTGLLTKTRNQDQTGKKSTHYRLHKNWLGRQRIINQLPAIPLVFGLTNYQHCMIESISNGHRGTGCHTLVRNWTIQSMDDRPRKPACLNRTKADRSFAHSSRNRSDRSVWRILVFNFCSTVYVFFDNSQGTAGRNSVRRRSNRVVDWSRHGWPNSNQLDQKSTVTQVTHSHSRNRIWNRNKQDFGHQYKYGI